MQISLIVAHPASSSFTHALADAAHAACVALGHVVTVHDLYAEGFLPLAQPPELELRKTNDPLVERHCEEISAAEGLVVAHPNWWSQPPAILKGWMDRVLRPSVAYRFEEDAMGRSRPVGLLNIRTAVIINTASMAHEQEVELLGDPLDVVWRKAVLGLCGVHDVRRLAFGPMGAVTLQMRERWLEQVAETMVAAFPAKLAGDLL